MKIKLSILLIFIIVSITCVSQKKVDHIIEKAELLRRNGECKKSIKFYLKAIDIDSTIYYSYLDLAALYNSIAEHRKSIVICNKAVQIDSAKYGAYNNIGNAYSHLNNYPNAIKNFKIALTKKNVQKDTVLFNIANNYWRWNKLDSSILYYDKITTENLKFEPAYTNKAYVYILKKEYQLAKENIEKALILNPKSYNNWNNLGYVYLQVNDINNALKYVNKSLEMNPDNSWVYRNLGLIYKKQNNKKEACKNLDKSLKLEFIKYWGEGEIKELLDYCETK